MIFLTVVACEIGRNIYFAGTDQRTGSGCQVGIMGNFCRFGSEPLGI